MEEKIIETLMKFDLTRYEAIAFYHLNSLIKAHAPEISEKSKIPKTKIYSVLKSLNEKNFIEIEKGHPNLYIAINPSIIIKREKNKLNNEIKDTELELIYNHKNQIFKTQAPMWLIRGEAKIIDKEIELIKKAKKSINMRIGFLFEEEMDILRDTLINKSKEIPIKILASEECIINNKKVDIIKNLKNSNIEIRKANLPYVKMIILDGKEMLHIYSRFDEETGSPLNETSIGMWNQYPEICKNYDDRFNLIFYNKKK